MVEERYHDLLTNRYVCERCLTRYFRPQRRCKACGVWGWVTKLTESLVELAGSETELREIIARGQRLVVEEPGVGEGGAAGGGV